MVVTINIFKREKRNREDTHAWCQRTASVLNTLEKLFQNNSSMGKYDPCDIAKVSKTCGDLLSQGFAGQMGDACGGTLPWDLLCLRFQN